MSYPIERQRRNLEIMTILQKHLVFIPLFLLIIAIMLGALVMLLWNWLMPDIFGLPALSFWQAVGLLVLCKVLLGGLGMGGHHHGHHHHQHGRCGCNDGQNKLRERWEQMSPEERQRIIELHKCNDTEAAPDGK